jgi:S1-C subfamily serine protease
MVRGHTPAAAHGSESMIARAIVRAETRAATREQARRQARAARARCRLAATCTLLLGLAGCQWELFGGHDTKAPAVHRPDYAQLRIQAGPRTGSVWGSEQQDPGAASIDRLCDALAAGHGSATIACLPLVNHDLRGSGPWVSQLGVEIADGVARGLQARRPEGDTWATDDVGLRLAVANLSRASLSSLSAVAASGERLEADIIVFGTITRRDGVGALGRDVLTCEVQAYDVAATRLATSARWDVPSDHAGYRQVWDLAQTESSWMPDARWGLPETAPTLANELRLIAGDLAAAVAQELGGGTAPGVVYVAPLDTAAFVRALARLNAARATFAAEFSGRQAAARNSGEPIDMDGPIVLNGAQFDDLQAAESYVMLLGETLQATEAARFGHSFAALVAQELLERVAPAEVRLQDFGFTRDSDRALVEGELAQGGLVRSLAAREALRDAGVDMVAAPRLERLGDSFRLRLDLHDVQASRLAATASAPLPDALIPELQRALGTDDLQPVGDLERLPGSWEAVYSDARSGVVHVNGPDGRGSGFVVGAGGLVLTNDHVVRGVGTPVTVTTDGGPELAARLVSQDPYWDLAVLQVDGLPASTHVFQFAPAIEVGTEVAVLGHPRDSAGWVLTPGHVSSTTEQVQTPDGRARASLMYTCPTRQGSSGSPVLLADGRVAAVHSAGRAGQSLDGGSDVSELTGFALGVPAAEASAFLARAVPPATSRQSPSPPHDHSPEARSRP